MKAFVQAVNRAKPSGAKGTYLKKISLSSTMGPGVTVDVASATRRARGADATLTNPRPATPGAEPP